MAEENKWKPPGEEEEEEEEIDEAVSKGICLNVDARRISYNLGLQVR